MEKYNRKNLKNIQRIVQKKTGASIDAGQSTGGAKSGQMLLLVCSLLCFMTLCAFAYAKFSDLNGDEAGFAAVYQGEGRFEIVIVNDSDKELKLQNKVRVMQWSTGAEVEGDNEKIKMEISAIAPHSQGIVVIDISEGYDIDAMEEKLPEGDNYYFVLTNHNFAFGQDWLCFFDFEVERTEEVASHMLAAMDEREERKELSESRQYETGSLIYQDWLWPTVSHNVSGFYGRRENGTDSDHINIAGTMGDEVYAVADGVVTETAFESTYGNVIVVDLGNGITIQYGHLQEIQVSEGEEIKQGQVIATLGRSGMATGANLLFAVTADGEKVNPLTTE